MKTINKKTNSNIAFQKWIAAVGIILFIGKLVAWKLTNSDAVFSDAMESIVNVISAFLGFILYTWRQNHEMKTTLMATEKWSS